MKTWKIKLTKLIFIKIIKKFEKSSLLNFYTQVSSAVLALNKFVFLFVFIDRYFRVKI